MSFNFKLLILIYILLWWPFTIRCPHRTKRTFRWNGSWMYVCMYMAPVVYRPVFVVTFWRKTGEKHPSQCISPSSNRSILLSFTSFRIPCNQPISTFFTRSDICIWHFDHASYPRICISSCYTKHMYVHLSMLLCVHWILRDIIEFSIHVLQPYVITGSTHWSYAFFFKHSEMFRYIWHFGHASYPCIHLTITSCYTKYTFPCYSVCTGSYATE
jgi:hypothetical protein